MSSTTCAVGLEPSVPSGWVVAALRTAGSISGPRHRPSEGILWRGRPLTLAVLAPHRRGGAARRVGGRHRYGRGRSCRPDRTFFLERLGWGDALRVRRRSSPPSRSRSGPVSRRAWSSSFCRRRPSRWAVASTGSRKAVGRRRGNALRDAPRRDRPRRRRLPAPRPHRADVGQRLRRDLGIEGQDDLRRRGRIRERTDARPRFRPSRVPPRPAAALRRRFLSHRPLGRPRDGVCSFPFLQAATLLVLFGWLRRRGASPGRRGLATATLAWFEPLYSAFLTGMAEVPFSFGILLFGTSLRRRARRTDRARFAG